MAHQSKSNVAVAVRLARKKQRDDEVVINLDIPQIEARRRSNFVQMKRSVTPQLAGKVYVDPAAISNLAKIQSYDSN